VPSERDPGTGTITATVDHLTVFAVMAAPGLKVPTDLHGHWAQADVLKLVSLGIAAGFEELINEARAEAGLSPVILDETLSRVARTHAREMIDRGYFGHISPTHGSPGRRVREAGLSFSFVGENLAGHTSVTASHRALLASAAHRRNILHPEVEWVGLAYVRGGPYGGIIVELFVAPEREPAEGLED